MRFSDAATDVWQNVPARARRAGALALLAAWVLAAAPRAAMADVWGYVDEQGRPHVATEKLDDRYQLFFRGKSSADTPPPVASATDTDFVQTAIYQRVASHPNVKRFEPLVERYARLYDLDIALVKAVIAAESAYDPEAVSPKGALGLMQVIPATAERYGVADDRRRTVAQKLFDPAINLSVGTRYLRDLLALFAGDVTLALAAYNSGENTVLRYDRQVPPFPETQEYVKLVQQFQLFYRPPDPPAKPAAPPRILIPPKKATAP